MHIDYSIIQIKLRLILDNEKKWMWFKIRLVVPRVFQNIFGMVCVDKMKDFQNENNKSITSCFDKRNI